MAEQISRTSKFLAAVNRGLEIVTEKWLNDSISKHEWLDTQEENYRVIDPDNERKFKCDLYESLRIAGSNQKSSEKGTSGKLLDSYLVYNLDKTQQSDISLIVETAGGEVCYNTYVKKLNPKLCKR